MIGFNNHVRNFTVRRKAVFYCNIFSKVNANRSCVFNIRICDLLYSEVLIGTILKENFNFYEKVNVCLSSIVNHIIMDSFKMKRR